MRHLFGFLTAVFLAGAAVAEAPVLKVAVMGDIQGYPYPEDAGMRNLERALDVLAPFRPDVVASVGDINDNGRNMDAVRYFKARCDARLGAIPHVACLGNHEICFVPEAERAVRTSERCQADFNAVFGFAPGKVVSKTVGGCDFIALSFGSENGYSADEIASLKSALDEAAARNAGKPIFVLTHYHPYDTVNSSDSRAYDGGLRALLNGYPQVVNLSGHTHNPLQDPRSIWQGEFTAVDTSTLCYGCIDNDPPAANQISCLLPYGHESVGCLLVEVYEKRMVIRRFSVRDRCEIEPGAPWSFELPYDPARPKYDFASRRAATPAPEFTGDVEPTVWYDYGYVFLMFESVKDMASVFGYRIELAEDGGGTRSYFHVADYYRNKASRASRIVFKCPPHALSGGRMYRCRIFPVGFFGREGNPACWSFTAKKDYPYRADKPNVMAE